ncbi:hypothetical protein FRC10_000298 [Ceratobasidium sp. 414]|nr:hypothetical protein FRC10_000298 [Ceratobasidium sp. 414]
MPWPDFSMGARPALPPQHPNWEQEKNNLIDWFEKLWSWQGGYEDLQWAVLVKDVNAGNFEYFDKDRLPAEYVKGKDRRKLTEPAEWDEETTAIWSSFVRSTMDIWGRVPLSQTSTALQFRRVDLQREPKTYETFLLEPPACSNLDWKTPALLFERRVKRAMGATPAREGEVRASALYDHAVQLVAEIGEQVRGLDSLLGKLHKYESLLSADFLPKKTDDLKVVTIPSVERSHNWHPAAAQVSRALEMFADNADLAKHTFPEEFLSRLARGHHRWDVTALRDWVQSKPFWDDGAKMLRGGTAGIAVAFFAILHYALNVARVMPKDKEDADRLCDQDKAVYGRADFRTLSQCAEAIAQQLAECAISELAQLRLTSSDFEDRHSAWLPKVWVQWGSDGGEQVATFTASRPSFNVFLADADTYMESRVSTAAGTPGQPAHVTPESPAIESTTADITHIAEDGVSKQADVPMNDPEIHPALNIAGQEVVVRPIIPSVPSRGQIPTVVLLQDVEGAETRNKDVASARFEGATTSTSRREGQAQQAVVLDPAIQADELRATESPIAGKSLSPSRDPQPTKPAEEQPPATPVATIPSLPHDNPSTTKLWKFSERLRAASTGGQQLAQKATSNMNADSGSRGSGSGGGCSANVSRKRARGKVSSESAAPEMSKKAK